jgi:hypothetical protein
MLPATIAVRVLAIGFSAATFRYRLAIPSNSPAPEAIGRGCQELGAKVRYLAMGLAEFLVFSLSREWLFGIGHGKRVLRN